MQVAIIPEMSVARKPRAAPNPPRLPAIAPLLFGRRGTPLGAVLEADPAEVKPNPDNPRGAHFDTTDLELSIQEFGQRKPGLAVRDDAGGWLLLHGHRRREACRRLGIKFKFIEVKPGDDAVLFDAILDMALDNLHQPLPPTRLAAVIEHMVQTHGWTTERAGRALGLTPAKAALIRSILNAPPTVREALDKPPTAKGHLPLAAYNELPRSSSPAVQERVLADAAQSGRVTVQRIRQAKRAAQDRGEAKRQRGGEPSPPPAIAPGTASVIEALNRLRADLVLALSAIPALGELDQSRAEFILADIKTMLEGALP